MQSPVALSQVLQPEQGEQEVAVLPREKVLVLVQGVHVEVLVNIVPGEQEEQNPSVAEHMAQLGQGWQTWLLFAGLKVMFEQGTHELLKLSKPVPAGQVRQTPLRASQVEQSVQFWQGVVPLEKVAIVQAAQVPLIEIPDPGLQERHCPLVLSQVRQLVQAAQTEVVPPGEKVSLVQMVHEEVFVRIDPASQAEHEPSVAEQTAQLRQG